MKKRRGQGSMHFDAAYAAPSSKHDRHLPSQLRGQTSPQPACSDVPPTSSKKQLPKVRGVGFPQLARKSNCPSAELRGTGRSRGSPRPGTRCTSRSRLFTRGRTFENIFSNSKLQTARPRICCKKTMFLSCMQTDFWRSRLIGKRFPRSTEQQDM